MRWFRLLRDMHFLPTSRSNLKFFFFIPKIQCESAIQSTNGWHVIIRSCPYAEADLWQRHRPKMKPIGLPWTLANCWTFGGHINLFHREEFRHKAKWSNIFISEDFFFCCQIHRFVAALSQRVKSTGSRSVIQMRYVVKDRRSFYFRIQTSFYFRNEKTLRADQLEGLDGVEQLCA